MALKAYITTAGATVLNKIIAQQVALQFTKAELGSGSMTDPDDADEYRAKTALITKNADAAIGRCVFRDNSAKVTVQYQNDELESALTVREIGIYVKDPDNNANVLYCYANFGSSPDVIQPVTAAQFARMYELIIAVTGATAVTVTVAAGAYQEAITAIGLLISDGQGNITSVSADYYALAGHSHALTSAQMTGILPISKGGTNAGTAKQALVNLGIVYSATEPTYIDGGIWLQPVE